MAKNDAIPTDYILKRIAKLNLEIANPKGKEGLKSVLEFSLLTYEKEVLNRLLEDWWNERS